MRRENIQAVLKLPAVGLGLTYFTGCLAAYLSGDVMRTVILCIAGAAAAAAVAAHKFRIWAVGLLLGLLSMTAYLQLYYQPLSAMDGSSVRTECRMLSASTDQNGWTSGRAFCVIDGYPAMIGISGSFQAQTGDTVSAVVELQQARQDMFTFSDGVVLNGTVKETFGSKSGFSLLYHAQNIRSAAASKLGSIGGEEAELCKGILLGDTSGFSLRLRRDITRSGVNYMTAVSGAHITLCIMILMELFGRKRPFLQAGIAIAAAVVLAVLFGFTPSVMRAGVMMILCKCGVLLRRKADTTNSLCAAILALTLFSPYAAADPALQMSCLGVFGSAVVGRSLNGLRRFGFERHTLAAKLKEAVLLSFGAMVCIAPVSISCFGGISLAEIPASVILSPFFTAAVVLGIVCLTTGLGLATEPLEWVMSVFRDILSFFGEMDGAWLAMDNAAAVPLAFLAAALLVTAAFVPDYSKNALECCVLTILLFLSVGLRSSSGRMRVDMVSDGQSGAAVFCSRNEAAIIISGDGGGLAYEIYDELMRSGITRISLINAPQAGYSGMHSISQLTELFPTERILCPEDVMRYAEHFVGDVQIGAASQKMTVNSRSIACAKVGEPVPETDIVIYYGYTLKEPEAFSGLPLYCSSRQKKLPPGGINIYRERVRIELR